MAYHQTGGLVRSVTDRTGQAQLTSKQITTKPGRETPALVRSRQDTKKKPVDPAETAENQRYEYDYSTNRDPELSRPEEDFRRTQSPQSPNPTLSRPKEPKNNSESINQD